MNMIKFKKIRYTTNGIVSLLGAIVSVSPCNHFRACNQGRYGMITTRDRRKNGENRLFVYGGGLSDNQI